MEAGPRRGCCRPWGRRASSDRFNAPTSSTPPKGSAGPSGAVDGPRRGRLSSGVGRGRSRRISRGHFLLIWIILGRGLFRLVGSRTSGWGRRLVAGRAGGVGRFWGGRLSERGPHLRTAGGGDGGGRRSSGDLGPHPSRADFREGAGEGSRPGGGIAGIETRTSRGSKVNPTEIKWWRSQGSKLGDLRYRKVFEVWGRTGLLLKMGPFWGARSSSRMVESSGPN